MPGFAQAKLYCQFVENFCVYLQAKNLLHPPSFSGDIKKDMQPSHFGYFGHS